MDRMEWIIIDDGTDPIEDIVKHVPQVKYFRYEEKMSLGKKRNLMHEKSIGDILVYMDDDDYYPPERVSHAVHMLQTHKAALCAGASELYLYFKHISQMYQFGPYGPRHATAGTFAFKRELLKTSRYDDEAALAEEKSFLKNYTVPFVQLEPKKTILVFSHPHNTFDKRKLLDGAPNKFCKPSDKKVDEFIKDADLKDFYLNRIDTLLAGYEPGLPKHKPDVLKQTKEIEEERRKKAEANAPKKLMLQRPDGTTVQLGEQDMIQIIERLQEEKDELGRKVRMLEIEEQRRKEAEGPVKEDSSRKLMLQRPDGTSVKVGEQDMIDIIERIQEENRGLQSKLQMMDDTIQKQTQLIMSLLSAQKSQNVKVGGILTESTELTESLGSAGNDLSSEKDEIATHPLKLKEVIEINLGE